MFFLCKRNKNLETLTCKGLLSLLAHVFEEEQLSFYMFFDKSYCNSFVQKRTTCILERNMKCLIYKSGLEIFFNIVSLKMKGDHLFLVLGSWELLKI